MLQMNGSISMKVREWREYEYEVNQYTPTVPAPIRIKMEPIEVSDEDDENADPGEPTKTPKKSGTKKNQKPGGSKKAATSDSESDDDFLGPKKLKKAKKTPKKVVRKLSVNPKTVPAKTPKLSEINENRKPKGVGEIFDESPVTSDDEIDRVYSTPKPAYLAQRNLDGSVIITPIRGNMESGKSSKKTTDESF
jgi:hypothetical protein